MIEKFQERINTQNKTLEIHIESDLPQVKTDISIVKRILSELINNASKYTPGNEEIIFSARSSSHGIELQVINTGVEISPVEQHRVFDKFYRIPNHDPWKFGGTGIGLALVENLINLLGGDIHLESQTGQTAFTIDLPCETIASG
ncbi:MAG: sensor histidine kinase [Pleurocapsa sp.]